MKILYIQAKFHMQTYKNLRNLVFWISVASEEEKEQCHPCLPWQRNQEITNLETTHFEMHHTFSHVQFIFYYFLLGNTLLTSLRMTVLFNLHYVSHSQIISGDNFASTSIHIRQSRKGWNFKTMTWSRQKLWKHKCDSKALHSLCSPTSCLHSSS